MLTPLRWHGARFALIPSAGPHRNRKKNEPAHFPPTKLASRWHRGQCASQIARMCREIMTQNPSGGGGGGGGGERETDRGTIPREPGPPVVSNRAPPRKTRRSSGSVPVSKKKKEPSANCAVYLRFFIRILGSEPTLAFSLKAGLVDETTAILLLSKAS